MNLQVLSSSSPDQQDRTCAITDNLVACARFFNLIVDMFVNILLKPDFSESGLFGKTFAYYDTVAPQPYPHQAYRLGKPPLVCYAF